MLKKIENFAEAFLEKIENKRVCIVSHYDTDGITAAAILSRALQRRDKKFSVRIIKQIEKEKIKELPKDEVLIFLDLSVDFDYLSEFKKENIFILDHHEVDENIPEDIQIINPNIFGNEKISGSGLTYLLVRAISTENKDLASLAVLGMVGDLLDKEINKLNKLMIDEAEVVTKRGLLLYPATRPLHKALEYNSSILIPGVTGCSSGCINLLRESKIEKVNGTYKSLIELDEEEMSRLITSVILKRMNREKDREIIGNIYLIKFFNKLEDARELSAMINACSRLENSGIALAMCLGNKNARTRAEEIYAKYKQHLINALNYIQNFKKIEEKGYVIINAKDNIKDTIIGTVASILSNSNMYEEGTVIVTMAYSDADKIKVSARISGRNGRNISEVLSLIVEKIGGECGGHEMAAGCLISREKEIEFIRELEKDLAIEVVKI